MSSAWEGHGFPRVQFVIKYFIAWVSSVIITSGFDMWQLYHVTPWHHSPPTRALWRVSGALFPLASRVTITTWLSHTSLLQVTCPRPGSDVTDIGRDRSVIQDTSTGSGHLLRGAACYWGYTRHSDKVYRLFYSVIVGRNWRLWGRE